MNHSGDTNKMVSDTPRTDAEYERLFEIYRNAERFHGPLCCPFENDMRLCRQLERELNAANKRISYLEEAVQDSIDACDRDIGILQQRMSNLKLAKEAKP